MRAAKLAIALGLTGILAIGAFFTLAAFVLHGPVTRGRLGRSLDDAVGSAGPMLGSHAQCDRRDSTWSCWVVDREGSGGAGYRVTVQHGSSCWHATLTENGAEGVMPRRAHGCVHLLERSLVDLL